MAVKLIEGGVDICASCDKRDFCKATEAGRQLLNTRAEQALGVYNKSILKRVICPDYSGPEVFIKQEAKKAPAA